MKLAGCGIMRHQARAMPHPPDWITTREAASRLGCAERTVLLRLKDGRIEGKREGKAWRVSTASVAREHAASMPHQVTMPHRPPKPEERGPGDSPTGGDGTDATAGERPDAEPELDLDRPHRRTFSFRDVVVLRKLADLATTVGKALAKLEAAPAAPARAAADASLLSALLGAAGYHAFVPQEKTRLYSSAREQAAMAAAALWVLADLLGGRGEGLRMVAASYEKAASGLGGLMRKAARRAA